MSLGVDITGVSMRFGNTLALDDLTLHLPAGKIHGLLGRNGSGKTTLLTLLAAYRRPTAGQIRIAGQDPFENGPIVRQLCLVREDLDINGQARVRDALAFAARFRPYWDQEYADKLVRRFDLPLDKRIPGLSRGKTSALGVILGLASRAPLTMFDEAYLGMDAPSRYAFYDELLSDYLAHPRTIILSTHLIEEVANIFEEVVVIDQGRLVLHEEADEMRGRGAAVTGPAELVDRFVTGLTVLGEQRLGGTKSATVYGPLTDESRRAARTAGLELGPVPLQDLFVHLTGAREEQR